MSTLLTLQAPAPRDPQPPLAGLLFEVCADADAVRARRRGALFGPPVLDAAALLAAGSVPPEDPVGVRLDVNSDLQAAAGARADRFEIDCSAGQLDDVIALAQGDPLSLPARLTVFVERGDQPRGWAAESATRICEAGAHPGLDACAAAEDVADFLAVLAHSEVGFVARARTGAEVVAVLAATVAALRGDDIGAAFVAADPRPVAALSSAASAAIREVLVGIDVTDPEAVESHLFEHGIATDLRS
ncbi:hypothetical protein [Rhodococcus kronopolitis]|uniref:Urease accessory protein UreF n=1 Tax=Rhodococcus kronopolitis TaxID=1460226 RepID=A0ABV9FYZ2_9NOCA